MAGKISLENINFYIPRFEVEIGGKKLDPVTSKAIVSVEVIEKMIDGTISILKIHDDFDISSQKFKNLDNPLFDIEKNIIIRIGYGNNLHEIFNGTIKRIEPSFFVGETPTFTIEAHDSSYDYLKRKTPLKKFKRMKYSDVAKIIAIKAKLRQEIDDFGELEIHQKNNNVTYFEFLKDISRMADANFFINRNTLYFVKVNNNRKEILSLELGRDIISFCPNIKTTKLLTEVEVRWSNYCDPLKPIVSLVKAGSERDKVSGMKTGSQLAKERIGDIRKVITCRAVNSSDHAQKIAEAELRKSNSSLIEGTGECLGIPQMRPGVMIGLKKVGYKFSGKYFVTEASHTINDNGYTTKFTVMRTLVNTL